MSYASKHLAKNEKIIATGKPSFITVIPGIFWFPVLGIIPRLIRMLTTELTLTDTRVVGKYGVIKSGSLDIKLDKVQNVTVKSGLGGKIFGYGTIIVSSAGGSCAFACISHAESLKQQIMAQIDIASEEKTKAQAMEMAKAMSAAMKN